MIKNLVFDLGNVLIEFKPKDYMQRLGFPKEETEDLFQIIFKDKRWNEFDRGMISIEEYTEELKKEHPEYVEQISTMFSGNWPQNFLRPKPDSINFLKRASSQYGIYILSNVSECVLDYVKSLEFFEYVDSGTYSYQIGSCKPESKIYDTFIAKNSLNPKECLFLDDLPQNIKAAQDAGMQGIVFNDNLVEVVDFLLEDKFPNAEGPEL